MAHDLGRTGLFLALVGTLVLTGCQLSSGQRYQVASQSYDAALLAFTAASLSGEISLEDLERFDIIRQQADALLSEWGDALDRGEDFDGYAEFQIILNRLILLKLELEAHNAGGDDGGAGGTQAESEHHGGDAVGYRTAA